MEPYYDSKRNIHSKIQPRSTTNQSEFLNPRHLSLKGDSDDHDPDYVMDISDLRKDRSSAGVGGQKGSGRQLEVALRKVITERLQHLKDRGRFHLENYGLANLTSMQIAMYMRRLFKRNDLQNYMTPDMINYVFGTSKNDSPLTRSGKPIVTPNIKDSVDKNHQQANEAFTEGGTKVSNESDTEASSDEDLEIEKYNDFKIVNFVKYIPGPAVPNIQIPPNKYQPLTRNSNVYRCARDQAYIYGRGKWINREIENLKQKKAAIAAQIEMIKKKKTPIILESRAPVLDVTETCSRLCAFRNKDSFKVKLVNVTPIPLSESVGTPLDEFSMKNKDTMAYYSRIDDRVHRHLSLNGAVPGDLLFHKYLKRMSSIRMVNKCSSSELTKCRQLAEVSSTPWTLGLSNAYKNIVLSEKEAHDNEILKMVKKKEKEKDRKEDKGDKNDSNNFYTVKAIAPLKLKLSGVSRKSDKHKSSNKRKFDEMFESEDDSRNASAVHTADEDGDVELGSKPRKISVRDSRRNSGANMSNTKSWNSKYPVSTPIIDVGCKLPTKADYAEIIVPSWSAWESPISHDQGEEECEINTEEYERRIEKYHEEMEQQEKAKIVVSNNKSQKKNKSSISKDFSNNTAPFTAEELLMSINGTTNKISEKVESTDVPNYDRPSYVKPYERRIFENSKSN
uniref:CNDH2_C domain-containing protein n=1 Tax=Strongyloides papillosus TaxID=174720 RepID=A0A0N5BMQ9_STREA